jgi:hypothetical protein
MADIKIDLVLRDNGGCLTIAGPLRLFESLVRSLHETGASQAAANRIAGSEVGVASRQDGDAA